MSVIERSILVPPKMTIQPSLLIEESLRYYLVRPSGKMVPLIPADQLPFQLQGLPNHLTYRQMSDEKWQFLTETNEHALPLRIDNPVIQSKSSQDTMHGGLVNKCVAPDHRVRTATADATYARSLDEGKIDNLSGTMKTLTLEPRPAVKRPLSHSLRELTPTLTESFASIYTKDAQRFGLSPRTSASPSGIDPDPNKKIYCTHWIRTGECDYLAQGCRYKHEMPAREKLREIGLNEIPRWWREKNMVRTPTWMQLRMNEGKKENSNIALPPFAPERRTMFQDILAKENEEIGHTIRKDRNEQISEDHDDKEPCGNIGSGEVHDLIDLTDSRRLSSPSPSTSSARTASDDGYTLSSNSSVDLSQFVKISTSAAPGQPPVLTSPLSSSLDEPSTKPCTIQASRQLIHRHSQTSEERDEKFNTSKPPMINNSPRPTISSDPVSKLEPKTRPTTRRPFKQAGLATSKHAITGKKITANAVERESSPKMSITEAPLEGQIDVLVRDRQRKQKRPARRQVSAEKC
ncbi:hypothetical protein B0J11DRAFT_159112 [Dendryphion nanum]|uniref:C3H1-type domain-containing protein n=1 Tax=Dendryphion nanum TaxID=256645 RepID=A0A9P9EE33_9PLEO|nr:hypothetical protein B0J11DRAFT_159112 [Dendryphion nanum]